MVFSALLPTSTTGAQVDGPARVSSFDSSSDRSALERWLRAGVFDDVDQADQRTMPSTSTLPGDDRIGWLAFYLIFTDHELSRYAPGGAMGARFDMFQFAGFPGTQPYGYPIHIVVRHSHVTLMGIVHTVHDKQLAEARAREAAGVRGVTNALAVADDEERP
jgi:hypothetical protein